MLFSYLQGWMEYLDRTSSSLCFCTQGCVCAKKAGSLTMECHFFAIHYLEYRINIFPFLHKARHTHKTMMYHSANIL